MAYQGPGTQCAAGGERVSLTPFVDAPAAADDLFRTRTHAQTLCVRCAYHRTIISVRPSVVGNPVGCCQCNIILFLVFPSSSCHRPLCPLFHPLVIVCRCSARLRRRRHSSPPRRTGFRAYDCSAGNGIIRPGDCWVLW